MKKINLLLFIVNITISIIFCRFCGTNPALSKDYCGNYLDLNSTHRCCYCKNNQTEDHYCLIVINEGQIEGYSCDCSGIVENEDLPGASCLKHKQTAEMIKRGEDFNESYCHNLAKDKKHPCCYYDDGIEKRCFSIGKITSKTLYTYSEFLNCLSNHQKINIFLIFMILLFFL